MVVDDSSALYQKNQAKLLLFVVLNVCDGITLLNGNHLPSGDNGLKKEYLEDLLLCNLSKSAFLICYLQIRILVFGHIKEVALICKKSLSVNKKVKTIPISHIRAKKA
ncbi:15999_t:CDS:2 [Gigaspora margarita]|uniref:15999_t:CDS:1 n=1 Tax=Gigaspora margarita TaxID=4874 RepID=A0ABN7UVX2_GIGMA|nr:15999_t:CDS:2 [Gigaspora margarita]